MAVGTRALKKVLVRNVSLYEGTGKYVHREIGVPRLDVFGTVQISDAVRNLSRRTSELIRLALSHCDWDLPGSPSRHPGPLHTTFRTRKIGVIRTHLTVGIVAERKHNLVRELWRTSKSYPRALNFG